MLHRMYRTVQYFKINCIYMLRSDPTYTVTFHIATVNVKIGFNRKKFLFLNMQGWEFALLFFCSLLFRSKSLILKSDCEQLLLSLFTKEQLHANRSCRF